MQRLATISCLGICLVLMAGVSLAQEEGDSPRRGGQRRGGGQGGGGGMMAGPMLADLADANHDEEVTEAEWNGFVASVSKGDGIHVEGLRARAFAHIMDADKNHKFEVADLQQLFESMDRDSNGALEEGEMSPRGRGGRGGEGGRGGRGGQGRDGEDGQPGRRGGRGQDGAAGGDGGFRSVQPPAGDGEQGGGDSDSPRRRRGGQGGGFDMAARFQRMMFRPILEAADTDGTLGITAEEWKTFKDNLKTTNGVVSDETILTFLVDNDGADEEENPRRRRRSPAAMLDFMIGANAEGGLTAAFLQETFKRMDANSDNKIDKAEKSARPGRGGRGGDGRGPVF